MPRQHWHLSLFEGIHQGLTPPGCDLKEPLEPALLWNHAYIDGPGDFSVSSGFLVATSMFGWMEILDVSGCW